MLYEVQTSALEARRLSEFASRLTYTVEAGASASIRFPRNGPFDLRRGYSLLPTLQTRLQAQGYQVIRQAQVSPEMARLESWGISPPYPEVPVVGLTVLGAGATPLYKAVVAERVFHTFDDVPPLLVNTLLFLENRELLTPFDPRSNPVIEWDRLAKASLLFAGTKLHLPVPLQGGSTLATQLEKYRHSPEGRTNSAAEKLRQMVGASLKAYRAGPDTQSWRRQIVVDYLNTMPLAAAPEYGELHGLGEGLYAWFGFSLADVRTALTAPGTSPAKAQAFKDVLALLLAVRAPTTYLVESRPALNAKITEYTRLLAKNGVIDPELAHALDDTPLTFLPHAPVAPPPSFVGRKASNAIRTKVMQVLGLPGLYELDRLQLAVDSTIDVPLQNDIAGLFEDLGDRQFVAAQGLNGEHLLEYADPSKVVYSLMLLERTPQGNVLRVDADNLDRPLDINDGIKMELGSTAKLRTVAHYLGIVAELHGQLSGLDTATLRKRARDSEHDPLTRWAADTLSRQKGLELAPFLQRALERTYSASPYEGFFTGGGMHSFGNFDRTDNHRILTVREGLRRSVNLVFIRLMRDIERYHQARLPYDTDSVLDDSDDPVRQRMLQAIAADEAKHFLAVAYKAYHGRSADEIVQHLLGRQANSPRHLAMLFFAWHHGASADELAQWLRPRVPKKTPYDVTRLYRAYGSNPRLTLADYAYLMSRHPLDIWCAGELVREPQAAWSELLERSHAARQLASAWLFKTRNRHAQDVRLRIRIERDAFARMTPYWQALGFPFAHLVPSYATAIGSSADRPAALADLMGIVVNDGVRLPTLRATRFHFAQGTPYETTLEPSPATGAHVMDPVVAQILRDLLSEVVSGGTARRVYGAFVNADGTHLRVGGKTGSGDNRFKTFARHGGVTSARPVNRTATFVFYIGDRYFGVLTAFVPGKDAGAYRFTSALPLAVLKIAAASINPRL